MKKRIAKWWFRRVIWPYLMAHKAECSAALIETTVYQMRYAGIKFEHINKWLRVMQHNTIKAYVLTGVNKDQVRLFYEYPDANRRKELAEKNIVYIAQ